MSSDVADDVCGDFNGNSSRSTNVNIPEIAKPITPIEQHDGTTGLILAVVTELRFQVEALAGSRAWSPM